MLAMAGNAKHVQGTEVDVERLFSSKDTCSRQTHDSAPCHSSLNTSTRLERRSAYAMRRDQVL